MKKIIVANFILVLFLICFMVGGVYAAVYLRQMHLVLSQYLNRHLYLCWAQG